MEKKVSIYFNSFVKSALERETLFYKNSEIDGPRSTIFKNIEYILKEFIAINKDNISAITESIYRSLNKSISNEKLSAYPVLIEEQVLIDVEELRLKINDTLGVKFNKMNFLNFILLTYYIQKKDEIIKREMEFWNQPYFKRGKQN